MQKSMDNEAIIIRPLFFRAIEQVHINKHAKLFALRLLTGNLSKQWKQSRQTIVTGDPSQ